MVRRTAKLALIAHVALFAFLVTPNTCTALPVDLGTAGPGYWSVLEVGAGTVTQSESIAGGRKKVAGSNLRGGITGNVGIAQNGHISGVGRQFNGDLYLGDNASAQFSGTYTNNRPVSGMVHLGTGATVASNSYSLASVSGSLQPMLNRARLDAINASTAAASLSPTSELNRINLKRGKSLTLAPGVYDLTSLQLKRATLTLSGSGSFVFNISSVFALKSARVLLAGGATESNVLFNFTGTNDVSLFGGKKGNSVLHGIILALNASVNLAQGLVVGEIISGKDISMSRAMIEAALSNVAPPSSNPDPNRVPEGTSTFALCLIALATLAAFRSLLVCDLATRIGGRR